MLYVLLALRPEFPNFCPKINAFFLELVPKELNHLAAILHVYAGGLNFMK